MYFDRAIFARRTEYMIPKIIHYCWFGEKEIPEKDKKCIESWKKYCPDYEIKRWDESNYDVSKNAYMREAYQEKKWGFVPDFARLDIIYDYGGIYLDTDVELVSNLDSLLKLKAYMGFENERLVNPGLGFGAEKGLVIIKQIRDSIYRERHFRRSDGTFDTIASPKYNTDYLLNIGLVQNNLKQNLDELTILPSEYLCPLDFETGELNVTNKTLSIHRFNASWQSEKEKRRIIKTQKIKRIFGKSAGRKIEFLLNLPLNFKFHVRTKGFIGACTYEISKIFDRN